MDAKKQNRIKRAPDCKRTPPIALRFTKAERTIFERIAKERKVTLAFLALQCTQVALPEMAAA